MNPTYPRRRARRSRAFARSALLLVALGGALALPVRAEEPQAPPGRAEEPVAQGELEALAASGRAEIRDAIEQIGGRDDAAALPVLRALRDDALRADPDGRLFIVDASGAARSWTRGAGEPAGERELRKPSLNAPVRALLTSVIAQLELRDSDPAVRGAAAEALIDRSRLRPGVLAALERAYQAEGDAEIRGRMLAAQVELRLASQVAAERLSAVRAIAQSGDLRFLARLREMLAAGGEKASGEGDPTVRAEAQAVVVRLARRQFASDGVQHLLYGLSLGSVLLLASLGLAITFGLMGVINMAHGEMIMLGAYSTYAVQIAFERYLPGAQGAYLAVALPVAFAVTTALGMGLERTLVRRLYGRPLESLLMTWGVSLVLIQTVRLVFGAQNVRVASPGWLSGFVQVTSGIALPYARIAVVVFAAAILLFVWWLLQRTRLGLEVRAVTQNRAMAASMGIATARVDMWTFGLGSGVAGLGGVALSQIFNVGPELGQGYIVDCFMVVVLGGVGKLAGAVAGALGLGIVNKLLEPLSGAVLGKIAVLGLVILSIQWRPEGIFALRGRAVEN